MKKVFKRPGILKDVPFHYCPGCTHGVAHRLVAEVIEELGIRDTAIGVAPVGCSVFAMDYFEIDMFQASHGRAPAVATGIKRVLPERVVFTYQGDGDLAAIGTGEFVHAATRGERITIVFINNAIYGMTGGQMAPTTIMGQITKTTPFGRDREINGFPIRVCSPHPEGDYPGQKVHQEGLRSPACRSGVLPGGGAFHLPDQLGTFTTGSGKMAGGKDGSLLPAW